MLRVILTTTSVSVVGLDMHASKTNFAMLRYMQQLSQAESHTFVAPVLLKNGYQMNALSFAKAQGVS